MVEEGFNSDLLEMEVGNPFGFLDYELKNFDGYLIKFYYNDRELNALETLNNLNIEFGTIHPKYIDMEELIQFSSSLESGSLIEAAELEVKKYDNIADFALFTDFKNQNGGLNFAKEIQNYREILLKIEKDPYLLENIESQTEEMCIFAIKQKWNTIKFVKNQTPEICLAAIIQDEFALEYVIDQTPELCLAAVNKNGMMLRYVKTQTPEIIEAAVKNNELSAGYVK